MYIGDVIYCNKCGIELDVNEYGYCKKCVILYKDKKNKRMLHLLKVISIL